MSTTPVSAPAAPFNYTSLNAPTTSTTGTRGTSATGSAGANTMSPLEKSFLKLLTTQLQNQDPLNPMDNAQMTSQLAQISTVDGIQQLNTTLQTMMSNATQSQSMQAAALVGHQVLVPGSGLTLQNGSAVGGINLSGPADEVKVTIKDSNGLAVRTLNLGSMAAGSKAFQWDGKTDAGAAAAPGSYTFSVSAVQGGNPVTASGLQLGTVSSVLNSSHGVSLNVGNLGTFNMSQVTQIY